LPLTGDRRPFPFLQTRSQEGLGAQFSPDGRWISYASNESGRAEVYVASFPGADGKWQVSTLGGSTTRWRHDGKELFFLQPDGKLMAAAVNGQGAAFEVGEVRPLFDLGRIIRGPRYTYDVTPDGQRFLVNAAEEQTGTAPTHGNDIDRRTMLVVNWPALLKN
jgi:hypothetical protein